MKEEFKEMLNIQLSRKPSLYEYCRKLTILYETDSRIYESKMKGAEDLRDEILDEILRTEDILREKIKNNQL